MTEGLPAALAAEHAAIYAYGPIGVRLRGEAEAAAHEAELAHRTRRDALILLLRGTGATPAPAAPTYALPYPVTDAPTALKLAVEIEERTAAVWRSALPDTGGEQRRQALDAMIDCAVRATRWRRTAGTAPLTVPFPGRAT